MAKGLPLPTTAFIHSIVLLPMTLVPYPAKQRMGLRCALKGECSSKGAAKTTNVLWPSLRAGGVNVPWLWLCCGPEFDCDRVVGGCR